MPTNIAIRDPIREDPLREPAQSLKAEHSDLVFDKLGLWVMMATVWIVFAFLEWYRWAVAMPPAPVFFTATACCFVGYAAYRIWRIKPELKRLQMGIRGEQAVGQFLQRDIVPLGYRVLHDICEDDCNIDHVAIGPAGVFAIETKTHSKPTGDVRVVFDGKQVTVNGLVPDRDPIAQAQACAAAVRRILKQFSGIDEKPRAVVLYPGWWVEEANAETWVLNNKRFAGRLRYASRRLSQQQIDVLAEALARYVRERGRRDRQ